MPVKREQKPIVIFIVGPTAIGKTRLSIKLARHIHGRIISADSMQVYKGMSVLSQAPAAAERKAVKHYLVGFLDPGKEYSVADFRKKATSLIASLIKNRIAPIVVGGSGLYVKALVDGLFPSPQADMKFRKRMQTFVSKYGSAKLHARLSKIDPDVAAKIHPNDSRRIIRALEIHDSTGRTMTELKKETKGLADVYRVRIFGINRPREEVYSAIDARVDRMFGLGVVEEVRRLKKRKLSKTAGAVLGFKEIAGYLDGEYDMDAAKDLMKKNTRHFAKRQLSWFRPDKRIRWFDVSKVSDKSVINRIAREGT